MSWNCQSDCWISRHNAIASIITANYVIAVVHFAGNYNLQSCRMKKRRKEKRYMRVTRSVFVISFMDMKILSASGMTDWCYCRYNIFVARNYSAAPPRFRETLCMSRVPVLTIRPRVMNIDVKCVHSAALSIPANPLCTRRSLLSMTRSHEDSAIRGPAAKFASKADVYSISPAQNERNIQEKMLRYIIVTCTVKNILYLC